MNKRSILKAGWLTGVLCLVAPLAGGCREQTDPLPFPEAFGSYESECGQDGAFLEETPEAETAVQTETAYIYVHVCGAVVSPGVYALRDGARAADAVAAAGGMLPDAAADYLNLAQYVSDGSKLVVPSLEEAADSRYGVIRPEDAADGNVSSETALININTATAEELMALPGIGSSKAERIVAYRNEYGAFASTEELMQVSGIGTSTYEALRDLICV